jgi:hypothetical protein
VNKLAAEFFGTFALVFADTGAIVINDVTFGLVILAMIYTIGDIVAPALDALIAVPVCRMICREECCEPSSSAPDARDQNGSGKM